MYSHILISTDGSEVAQKGVDHGLSLAKALGARVTIIMVTERFPIYASAGIAGTWVPGPEEISQYDAAQKGIAQKTLAAVEAEAKKLGVQAETVHVPDAYPAEAIVELAKARDCNLIVMASHGRRGLRKLVLGSQTSEVLTNSPVPVLVVR
ncbi:universal stress protein [Mesorhizobium sp. BAC0120]|uniref:universal stress protein n=1 Tax=Mesorhizobium sp. BAC0120 TaxID=3090670 RepID=UPI00298D3AD8|nr:universal stress protein [Mesorhizobium sp. BAC0120]MDW6024237.1 universal stress protein [Mesorhizobium sp. BAC0120]